MRDFLVEWKTELVEHLYCFIYFNRCKVYYTYVYIYKNNVRDSEHCKVEAAQAGDHILAWNKRNHYSEKKGSSV